MTKPTEEQVQEARAIVAQADAELAEQQRQANMAVIQPLLDIGLGDDRTITVNLSDMITIIQEQMKPAILNQNLIFMNVLNSTANNLKSLQDMIRSVEALNSLPE